VPAADTTFFRRTLSPIVHVASSRLRRLLGRAPAVANEGSPFAGATAEVAENGYAVRRLLAPRACRALLAELRARPPAPVCWWKDLAVASPSVYEIATDPRLLAAVVEILGDDVILWGSSLIVRGAGDVHPWHTDIESADPRGGALSVWLALENVTPVSSLSGVRGSHRFGVTLQDEARRHGVPRRELTDDLVAGWAAARGPENRIERLAVTDGEAVLFDGRLWHGSHNSGDTTRTALLLQYARPDRPIRMPDLDRVEGPVGFLDGRPPCLLVHGRDASPPVNLVVEEPVRSQIPASAPRLSARVEPLALPLAGDASGWRPYPLFRGSTRNLRWLSAHVSVLAPGRTPHPSHRHEEEEILIVLDGAAELVLVDTRGNEQLHPVRRGQWSYYPPGQLHTLRTPADEGATYLMFKWVGRAAGAPETLPTAVGRWDDRFPTDEQARAASGFAAHTLREGATATLRTLETHVSTVTPGGGYAAHRDAHDVAIVLFEGQVETLFRTAAANAVLFAPAGKLHGLRNTGSAAARYLVFEFHA